MKIPTELPEAFPQAARQHLLHRFEGCVQKGLDFQRKRCKEPVSCVDIQLATSLSFIFQVGQACFLFLFSVVDLIKKKTKFLSSRLEKKSQKFSCVQASLLCVRSSLPFFCCERCKRDHSTRQFRCVATELFSRQQVEAIECCLPAVRFPGVISCIQTEKKVYGIYK